MWKGALFGGTSCGRKVVVAQKLLQMQTVQQNCEVRFDQKRAGFGAQIHS